MLRVEDIRVTISGFIILRRVSLEVPPGALIALVGRNGAGKTTTLKSIMGIVDVWGGAIQLDGVNLLQVPAHRRARLGIGYVPEDRRLIGALTVEDNLWLPVWASKLEGGTERLGYIYGKMPEVAELARRRAASLSGGQQKLVALARALMSGSKLLLLDEPFEGLSPALGAKLAETIRELQRDGLSVLIAESDAKRLGVVDTLYTIERGEIVHGVQG
ncbi:MAG TPA: ATP-binding cassette domain-containing protein [Candidatus Tectomicrobia bacterium]|nr:ATP-binding cassette domain-containing protein [Candidatus Tectomicrobia bacterium]